MQSRNISNHELLLLRGNCEKVYSELNSLIKISTLTVGDFFDLAVDPTILVHFSAFIKSAKSSGFSTEALQACLDNLRNTRHLSIAEGVVLHDEVKLSFYLLLGDCWRQQLAILSETVSHKHINFLMPCLQKYFVVRINPANICPKLESQELRLWINNFCETVFKETKLIIDVEKLITPTAMEVIESNIFLIEQLLSLIDDKPRVAYTSKMLKLMGLALGKSRGLMPVSPHLLDLALGERAFPMPDNFHVRIYMYHLLMRQDRSAWQEKVRVPVLWYTHSNDLADEIYLQIDTIRKCANSLEAFEAAMLAFSREKKDLEPNSVLASLCKALLEFESYSTQAERAGAAYKSRSQCLNKMASAGFLDDQFKPFEENSLIGKIHYCMAVSSNFPLPLPMALALYNDLTLLLNAKLIPCEEMRDDAYAGANWIFRAYDDNKFECNNYLLDEKCLKEIVTQLGIQFINTYPHSDAQTFNLPLSFYGASENPSFCWSTLLSAVGNRLLQQAAANNDIKAIEKLLENLEISPQASDNMALRLAASRGHAAIVRLLLNDEGVDPTADNCFALRTAVYKRFHDIVDLLLQHPKIVEVIDTIHPSLISLALAVPEKDKRLLDRLIEYGLEISADDFYHAAWVGNLDIVALYAKRAGDLSCKDGEALTIAAEHDHAGIVAFLMDEERLKLMAAHAGKEFRGIPAKAKIAALSMSCNKGNAVIFKSILKDRQLDLTHCDFMFMAASAGHSEIVECLLEDGRMDPAKGKNWFATPINGAIKSKHIHIVALLWRDERVRRDVRLRCEAAEVEELLYETYGQLFCRFKLFAASPEFPDDIKQIISDQFYNFTQLSRSFTLFHLPKPQPIEISPVVVDVRHHHVGKNRDAFDLAIRQILLSEQVAFNYLPLHLMELKATGLKFYFKDLPHAEAVWQFLQKRHFRSHELTQKQNQLVIRDFDEIRIFIEGICRFEYPFMKNLYFDNNLDILWFQKSGNDVQLNQAPAKVKGGVS